MAITFNPAINSGVSFQGKKNKVSSNALTPTHIRPATAKTVGSRAGHNMRMLALGFLGLLGIGTTTLLPSCTKDEIDDIIPTKPTDLTVPETANAWYRDSLKLGTPANATDKIKKLTTTTKAGEITEIVFDYDKSTKDVQVTNQINYTKKYPNNKGYFIVEFRKNSINGLDEMIYKSDENFSTKIGGATVVPHKMKSASEGILNYGDGLDQGPITRTVRAANDSIVEKGIYDIFEEGSKVSVEYISSAATKAVSAAPKNATFVATAKDIERAALKSVKKASKVVR